MPLIIIGTLFIIAGALLTSPGIRNSPWSRRAATGRTIVQPSPRPAAFSERLMTAAILIALVGLTLAVVGFWLVT